MAEEHEMPSSAYRLKGPLPAVIVDESGYRITQLSRGSLFLPTGVKPDPDGMVQATYQGKHILVFASDLHDKAEPLPIGTSTDGAGVTRPSGTNSS